MRALALSRVGLECSVLKEQQYMTGESVRQHMKAESVCLQGHAWLSRMSNAQTPRAEELGVRAQESEFNLVGRCCQCDIDPVI